MRSSDTVSISNSALWLVLRVAPLCSLVRVCATSEREWVEECDAKVVGCATPPRRSRIDGTSIKGSLLKWPRARLSLVRFVGRGHPIFNMMFVTDDALLALVSP